MSLTITLKEGGITIPIEFEFQELKSKALNTEHTFENRNCTDIKIMLSEQNSAYIFYDRETAKGCFSSPWKQHPVYSVSVIDYVDSKKAADAPKPDHTN